MFSRGRLSSDMMIKKGHASLTPASTVTSFYDLFSITKKCGFYQIVCDGVRDSIVH